MTSTLYSLNKIYFLNILHIYYTLCEKSPHDNLLDCKIDTVRQTDIACAGLWTIIKPVFFSRDLRWPPSRSSSIPRIPDSQPGHDGGDQRCDNKKNKEYER